MVITAIIPLLVFCLAIACWHAYTQKDRPL